MAQKNEISFGASGVGFTARAGDVVLHGFDELAAKLRELPLQLERKVLAKATRAAAKPILVKAKANAPVSEFSGPANLSNKAKRAAIRADKKAGLHYPGMLRDSIKIRAIKRNRVGRVGVVVQTRDGEFKGRGFYGAFVEYGTSKMAAKPYLRPAFDSEKDAAIDIVAGVVRAELSRIAAMKA